MLTIGSEIDVVPEKPVAGGSMLARHEGRVVLVRGAIPGERVRARIERVARDVAHAAAIEIMEPHADRRQPPIDPGCGGNAFAHIAYKRQLTLKTEIVSDAFARIARVTVPTPLLIAPSPERGYRMRARFHVRGSRAGFYREGTHELCDPATSGQLQPEAMEAVHHIARTLHAGGAGPVGVLGIELAENIAADERAVHVEFREAPSAAWLAGFESVDGLTGLSWSLASDPRTHVLTGSPYVTDGLDIRPLEPEAAEPPSERAGEPGRSSTSEVPPVRVQRHVRAFFQANRYLLSELVERVLSHVPEGPVVDLYAGVGLFAVALASTRRDAVVAVEGDAISAHDLTANAAACGRPFASYHLRVEQFLRDSSQMPCRTVVLDPPRTGLSRNAAAGILRHQPRRLVYVSCDVATLARDVRVFLQAGYELTRLEAFDLFPNTAHVETIAILDKAQAIGDRR